MTIFARKVRHVSPIRDVYLCLAAKYLHIDIFDLNLEKVQIFCVLLLYVLCSCEVFLKFPPLFGDHRLGEVAGD